MAATNAIKPAPDNSADTEARRLLRQQAAAHLSAKPLTHNNGSVASPIAGTKVSGGARINGGSV